MHMCMYVFTYVFAYIVLDAVLLLWFNAIFKHNIGYTWRPVLLVEEEPGKPPGKNPRPREATGKLSHITTLAESWTRTRADSGEMAVVRNGQRFRPLGAPLKFVMLSLCKRSQEATSFALMHICSPRLGNIARLKEMTL